jgi:hypothetical protein
MLSDGSLSAKEVAKERETLTAEQVFAEVDEYCATKGNPSLAPLMRQSFEETGLMPRAVLATLRLKPVMMWQRLHAPEKL